jgi:hypothetical protein
MIPPSSSPTPSATPDPDGPPVPAAPVASQGDTASPASASPQTPATGPMPLVRPAPARARRNTRIVIGLVAGAGLFFAGVGVGLMMGDETGGAAGGDDLLEAAKETCAVGSSDVRIGDDGDTMSIDRAGAEEMQGATMQQLDCLLVELDFPDAVVDRIRNTRALDGYQEETFGELTAAWTYHPDDGLNMTVTRTG